MNKYINNKCRTCGGEISKDVKTGKHICDHCGNEYRLDENNVLQQITVKDLDDQRTKIVDDIKVVINDTYSRDTKEISEATKLLTSIHEEQKEQKVKIEKSKKKIKKSKKKAIIIWIVALFTVIGLAFFIFYNAEAIWGIGQRSSLREDGDSTFEICVNSNGSENYVQIIQIKDKSISELEIPEYIGGVKVVSISSRAFEGCSNLVSVYIPQSIVFIGDNAFADCDLLMSVTFIKTSNWIVERFVDEIPLESSDLANTSTAAQYLTSVYVDCCWYNGIPTLWD